MVTAKLTKNSQKPARNEPISLHPLDTETVLDALLRTPVEPKAATEASRRSRARQARKAK